MMNKRNLFCFGFAGVLLIFLATVSHAAPISIANNSFEDEGLAAGGWSNVITAWDEDNLDSNGSFVEHIAGFNAGDGGTHHIGINSLATSISNGVVPAGTTTYSVWQDLGVPLAPNSDYTLTVAIGNRNASFTLPGNESVFAVDVGSSTLKEGVFDASTIPEGTFEDRFVTFSTGATPPLGNIVIRLSNNDPTGIGSRSHFDNVRLDVVPEPTTCAMAILALLGTLGIVRRRT